MHSNLSYLNTLKYHEKKVKITGRVLSIQFDFVKSYHKTCALYIHAQND